MYVRAYVHMYFNACSSLCVHTCVVSSAVTGFKKKIERQTRFALVMLEKERLKVHTQNSVGHTFKILGL